MSRRITVSRSSMPPIEEYLEEIRSLWDSRWLTNYGTKHNELEAKLAEYMGVENLILYVNGQTALQAALEALELSGEVITTPYTFISTTHAIVRNGLTPVYCDIRSEDCNIDVSKIEALITEKTSAIVPVHIYGSACDVAAIDKIAQKYHLKVVYDAAQATGVTINGKGIGNFGDASIFSFHATKAYHTIEGGAVTYSDPALKDALTKLPNYGHGRKDGYGADYPGFNGKMNEFQAAMGICNLRYIDGWVAKRKTVDERYRSRLKDIKGIRCLPYQEGVNWNYTYFPIIVEDEYGISRDDLIKKMNDAHIYPKIYFAPLMIDCNCYQGAYGNADVPVARHIVDRVLALPMNAELSADDVDTICTVIGMK